MLPKLYFENDNASDVQIRKFAGERDVSHLGAFVCGTVINIELTVSRRIGASGAVLRICRDGERDSDLPLDFCRTDNLSDVFCISLDTGSLCKDSGEGLFYYEFLLLRGNHTLFTDTYNNKDFTLEEKSGFRFR